jgi:clan AA aspartic protease (TIGR02281 family)
LAAIRRDARELQANSAAAAEYALLRRAERAGSATFKLSAGSGLFIVGLSKAGPGTLVIIRRMLAIALAVGFSCAAWAGEQPQQIVAVEPEYGAFVVPVVLNDVITAKFIVDSGAADVSITEDMVSTLMQSGTMTGADLLGSKTYMLADGTMLEGKMYRMASIRIGGTVMKNVTVRIASAHGSLLLGQSFLRRLKSWSLDNARQVLIIN